MLDALHHTPEVDPGIPREALGHETLTPVHVVRSEGSVRGALGEVHHAPVPPVAAKSPIGTADSLDVADVVAEEGDDHLEPVPRRDSALPRVLAAKDLLAHESHEHRVLHVVVERVAPRDELQDRLSGPPDDPRVLGLLATVAAAVALFQGVDERVHLYFCQVEHGDLLGPSRRRRSYARPRGSPDRTGHVEWGRRLQVCVYAQIVGPELSLYAARRPTRFRVRRKERWT